MSHVVEIATQVRDVNGIRLACRRLGLDSPVYQKCQLFSTSATGWCVQLRDWRYPLVCNTETGEVAYDNYGGRWGEERRLHQFLQSYAVEKSKLEARRQGFMATEQELANGNIRVTIQTGATA